MTQTLFSPSDIESAASSCNFGKALGPDGFDGTVLIKNQELMNKVCGDIAIAMNSGSIPNHLKLSRIIPLSKRKGSAVASLNEIRTIAVGSHLMRIIEKAIMAKLEITDSKILKTKDYQTGFRPGMGTHRNMTVLLSGKEQYKALLDLTKAFDRVYRLELKTMLFKRCRNPTDQQLSNLIANILTGTRFTLDDER